jgi:hypothetical protein
MTTAPPPESLLVGHIRAHIKQGEKARERADQAREKAEQHFIAAGQYLIILKAHYARSWGEWETLLKAKVTLSTGRASELMQLADGRKDLQQLRADTAKRVEQHRAQTSSSLQGRCNEEKRPTEEEAQETLRGGAGLLLESIARESQEKFFKRPERLIDALTASSSTTRAQAAQLLISGPRQSQFQSAVTAVSDLYQTLARAGR